MLWNLAPKKVTTMYVIVYPNSLANVCVMYVCYNYV